MLVKTKGIILNYIPYRETSIIVKIFTKELGTQSYIQNGVRSTKGHIALFQSLSQLDLVVYSDDKKELHRISEFKSYYIYRFSERDIVKNSIFIFLGEILNKTLVHHQNQPDLFDFITESLQKLDQAESGLSIFSLVFLLNLTHFFGFGVYSELEYRKELVEVGYSLKYFSDITFEKLLHLRLGEEEQISRKDRLAILDSLLVFYNIHFPDFGETRSLEILNELLH